jgi:hypothetical protein
VEGGERDRDLPIIDRKPEVKRERYFKRNRMEREGMREEGDTGKGAEDKEPQEGADYMVQELEVGPSALLRCGV